MNVEKQTAGALAAKLKNLPIAMFTTTDQHGHLVSQPMAQLEVTAEGWIWFLASDQSQLWCHIAEHKHVNLGFASPADGVYVSVSGHAKQVRDSARVRHFWKPEMQAWWPSGVVDPHLQLVCVEAHTAEYWDAHANRMVQLYHRAKAAVTGQAMPPAQTEHGRMTLQ